MLTRLVQQGGIFHSQIVTLGNKLRVLLQLPQPFLGRNAQSFPKLVALVEYASARRIGAECSIVCRAGFFGLLQDVEIADAQIPPGDGQRRVDFDALLPATNRFFVAAAVVEQIAEKVRCVCVLRIGAYRSFQHGDFLQPSGKAIVDRPRGRLVIMLVGSGKVAHAIIEPTERVIDQRTRAEALRRQLPIQQIIDGRAILQDFDRFQKQPCVGGIMCNVEPRLRVGNRLAVQQMPCPGVQRIAGQCLAKEHIGL